MKSGRGMFAGLAVVVVVAALAAWLATTRGPAETATGAEPATADAAVSAPPAEADAPPATQAPAAAGAAEATAGDSSVCLQWSRATGAAGETETMAPETPGVPPEGDNWVCTQWSSGTGATGN